MILGKLIALEKPQKEDMPKLLEWRNNPDHRKYYREYRESNLEDQLNWYENIMMKDSTWHHFVATSNGTYNRIYIDGTESVTTGDNWLDCCWVKAVSSFAICSCGRSNS